MSEYPGLQSEIDHELNVRPKSSGIVLAMPGVTDTCVAFDILPLDEQEGLRVVFSAADTAFAVREKSSTDKELRRKGIPQKGHIFFPDSIIDMTAFRPGEKRLAVTVSYDLIADDSGIYQPGTPTIQRTAFEPHGFLKYDVANIAVTDHNHPDREVLRNSLSLAQQLIVRRMEMGSIPYLSNRELGQILSDIELTNQGIVHQNQWRIVLREMERLTNEVVTRYCIENNIPQIFRANQFTGNTAENEFVSNFLTAQESGDQSEMDRIRHDYYKKVKTPRYRTEPTTHAVFQVPYAQIIPPYATYAQLVNVRNVLAFIEGRSFDYPIANLAGIARHLNTMEVGGELSAVRVQEEQKKGLATLLDKINGDSTLLSAVDNVHFRALLLLCLRTATMPSIVQEEASIRILAGTADSNDAVDILLLSGGMGTNHNVSIQRDALVGLYKHGHYADKILGGRANQEWQSMKGLLFFESEVDGIDGKVYTGYATATVGDKIITSDVFVSNNKRRSSQLAAANLFSKYLQVSEIDDLQAQDVAFSETADVARLNNDEAEEIKERNNFPDKLRKLCERNSWVIEKYETHIDKNTVSDNRFEAEITIKIGDFIFTNMKSGKSARLAEYLISKWFFNQLQGPDLSKVPHIDILDEINLREGAIILAQRHRLTIPEFIIVNTGTNEKPVVNCICTYSDPDERLIQFVGWGDTEEEAVNSVATKIIIVMDRIIHEQAKVIHE